MVRSNGIQILQGSIPFKSQQNAIFRMRQVCGSFICNFCCCTAQFVSFYSKFSPEIFINFLKIFRYSHNISLKYAKSIPLTFVLAVFQHLAIYNTPRNYKYLVFYAYTIFVNFTFQASFLYFIPKFCSFKQRKMKHK